MKRSENERGSVERQKSLSLSLSLSPRQNVVENANADTVNVCARLTRGTSSPFEPSSLRSPLLTLSISLSLLRSRSRRPDYTSCSGEREKIAGASIYSRALGFVSPTFVSLSLSASVRTLFLRGVAKKKEVIVFVARFARIVAETVEGGIGESPSTRRGSTPGISGEAIIVTTHYSQGNRFRRVRFLLGPQPFVRRHLMPRFLSFSLFMLHHSPSSDSLRRRANLFSRPLMSPRIDIYVHTYMHTMENNGPN